MSSPQTRGDNFLIGAGVEVVGVIKVDMSSAVKSKLPSRRIGSGIGSSMLGTKHWNFSFDLEVMFGAASSSLMFRTLIEGVSQGTAHIGFD